MNSLSEERPLSTPELAELFERLKWVQDCAIHQYWLTSAELCSLLCLSTPDLYPDQSETPVPSLAWRNYQCLFQQRQGQTDYWCITANSGPSTPASKPSRSSLAELQQNWKHPQSPPPLPATDRPLSEQFIQIDNLLSQQQLEELLAYVFSIQDQFVDSGYERRPGYDDYRKSRLVYWFPPYQEQILDQIEDLLPKIAPTLQLPPSCVDDITGVEAQLTLHNHGNYYRVHNDNGSEETASRFLTFVYYFYQEPKGFSGGELRLYNQTIAPVGRVKPGGYIDIEPRNNSIVFFRSELMHEVLPVRCPSLAFTDSRFTVNGWVRQGSPPPRIRTGVSSVLTTAPPSPKPQDRWIEDLLFNP